MCVSLKTRANKLRMQPLESSDPASLSYWLNWRALLCAIWVLISMLAGSYLIWKYERLEYLDSDGKKMRLESLRVLHHNESWKPCLKEIHPFFLILFRIIAFCLLSIALSFDVAAHGLELFYYYTQWTFTLSAIYFGFGSVLSIHGYIQHYKKNSSIKSYIREDAEEGLYRPLAHGVTENVNLSVRLEYPGKFHVLLTSQYWGYLFQVLFQMTAGAVTLTDAVYWGVIFPFLDIKDYEMSFLTVLAHSLAGVLLLGDIAINCLHCPWFRISYFLWWTSIYVIFQWIVHACVSIWWPYPFLDLSMPQAPLWYLIVALMHIPCYGMVVLIVKLKHFLMSKWFPHSYQSCP